MKKKDLEKRHFPKFDFNSYVVSEIFLRFPRERSYIYCNTKKKTWIGGENIKEHSLHVYVNVHMFQKSYKGTHEKLTKSTTPNISKWQMFGTPDKMT